MFESLIAGMTDEVGMLTFTMISQLAENGITPEAYAGFYNIYMKVRPLIHPGNRGSKARSPKRGSAAKASANGGDTLLLRIQMKGVTKPPMWREVEMPADATFLHLHDVIQTVMGLENYHLWQFNERAYQEDLQIGLEHNGFDGGLDYVTDDASETPISRYLSDVGDKLEYVYDFGDDWIFVVSVKKVLDKKSGHAVCVAFKSDLNAMEDSGGVWGYEQMRHDYAEWGNYTKKKREEIAEDHGYDSAEDYYESLQDNMFDIDEVNADLKMR